MCTYLIVGEVQIHRLNWQKVWNFSPPKDCTSVRAMAWRPDGKVRYYFYFTKVNFIIKS